MEKEYESCTLCPRNCGIDRNSGETGFCGETADIRVAWAGFHFGEEPPITGKNGSGTIFITGCNLRCAFCQNYQISQEGMGRVVTRDEFAELCLLLEREGAENINIVTGSHAIPGIATGLRLAKNKGLAVPVLWNTSAYETEEAIELLKGLVDGWMPDLKTLNPLLSESVFQAADYPSTAKKAIRKMVELSPLNKTATGEGGYPQGKLLSGVIVRHLAIPGKLADTELVLKWFAEHLKGRAELSLMTQYTPVKANPKNQTIDAFPNRLIQKNEYERLTEILSELDIEDGYMQELVEDTEWLPDFARPQPFSNELARPVWHWKSDR